MTHIKLPPNAILNDVLSGKAALHELMAVNTQVNSLTDKEIDRLSNLRCEHQAKLAAARLNMIMELPARLKNELLDILETTKLGAMVEEIVNLDIAVTQEHAELEHRDMIAHTAIGPAFHSYKTIDPVYVRTSRFSDPTQELFNRLDCEGWPSKDELLKSLTQWALEDELSKE